MHLACARCEETLVTEAVITPEAEENTSCSEWANTVYTASFIDGDITVTDTLTLQNVPPLPYSPASIEPVDPTCTEPGLSLGEYCTVCGEILTPQEEVPAYGHNWELTETEWAEDGSACVMHLVCVRCGEILDAVASITSVPEENTSCTEWAWTEYTAAFTDGDETYTDTLRVQDVPPIAHTVVTEPAVPPTDREPGLTERQYCKVCGEELLEAQEIPALWSYEDDGLTVVAYNGGQTDLTIPSGVNTLGPDLFRNNTSVTSVRIPDEVVSIGATTFFGATSLREIWLPGSLDGITSRTFYNVSAVFHAGADTQTARALSYNRIPFTDDNGWTMIYTIRNADADPTAVRIMQIPDEGETELTIPPAIDGIPVTELTDGAVSGHASLTDVFLPDSLSVFGEDVFAGSASPRTVHSSMTAREWALAQGYLWVHDPHAAELIPAVPATCEESGLTEGSRCAECGEILIPQETVPALDHAWGEPVYVWGDDFASVTATRVCLHDDTHQQSETVSSVLSLLSLPTASEPGLLEHTASFTDPAFTAQSLAAGMIPALGDMDTLYLPASLRRVQEEGFRHIASQAVIIPDGCTSIGANAFADCPNLLYVFIPASVTEIGEGAFSNCPLVFIYRAE